jgi:hypothetical protein
VQRVFYLFPTVVENMHTMDIYYSTAFSPRDMVSLIFDPPPSVHTLSFKLFQNADGHATFVSALQHHAQGRKTSLRYVRVNLLLPNVKCMQLCYQRFALHGLHVFGLQVIDDSSLTNDEIREWKHLYHNARRVL